MAEILLFHHAQGLTPGCQAFAEELRVAGHRVHAPDLYEGKTFPELAEGVRFAEDTGFETIVERGRGFAEGLPYEIVYAGLSLGVVPAQMLAQTRAAQRGRCCYTPASRRRSSAVRGRAASRSRST